MQMKNEILVGNRKIKLTSRADKLCFTLLTFYFYLMSLQLHKLQSTCLQANVYYC